MSGALLAASLTADAQQSNRVRRIGVLLIGSACPTPSALTRKLTEFGWIEGRTVEFDCVSAGGRFETLPSLARQLVARHPDLLVSQYNPAARALKAATSTIPIVMMWTSEPVRSGVAQGLAHPGGNVTGLVSVLFDVERKRIDLLKEMLPRLDRLAVIGRQTDDPYYSDIDKIVAEAAHSHGFTYHWFRASQPEDYPRLFKEIAASGFDAVYLVPNPLIDMNPPLIGSAALARRLPAIGSLSALADAGVLLTYGPNFQHNAERAAIFVDKILRGSKPGDLPFEQPTRFELAINLKAAKALGLTIPQSMLVRADRVIE